MLKILWKNSSQTRSQGFFYGYTIKDDGRFHNTVGLHVALLYQQLLDGITDRMHYQTDVRILVTTYTIRYDRWWGTQTYQTFQVSLGTCTSERCTQQATTSIVGDSSPPFITANYLGKPNIAENQDAVRDMIDILARTCSSNLLVDETFDWK